MITPLCRTGDRDRDAQTPAPVLTAATGDSLRTLAALTEQPLTVIEDAVGTPGDLSQCRERGWPRLAVVDHIGSHQIRRPLCAGNDQLYAMPNAWGADGARSRRAAAPQTDTTLAGIFPLSLATERSHVMHAGRSHGPHGETALAIVDFGAWERRATADGVIDDREVREGMSIMRRLIAKAGTLVTTVEVAMSSFGSPDGLYGQQPIRKWNEAQRRRPANVVTFPSREEEGPEAA